MKHVFIVNPLANNGKMSEKIKDIYAICKSLEVDFEIFVSNYRADAISLANMYKDDEKVVVYAVGGDGTINVIMNELIGGKAFLGVLPLGSGNDFYRGLPDDLIINCNVMKVNDRYCINLFSVGIDAEICQNAEKMKKLGIPSKQIYNTSILYTFLKHKDQVMNVDIDGLVYRDKMTLTAVFNGNYYGGGYKLNPNGSVESSIGDVYMLSSIPKIQMISFLRQVQKCTHESNPSLTKTEGHIIKIDTDYPAVANIDGEILISDHFNIDTHASRMKVVKNDKIIRELKKRKVI